MDSSVGYVPGNVNIISFRANTLKNNGTLEEFKKLIKWMELYDENTATVKPIAV
jgi:hypothetical protein